MKQLFDSQVHAQDESGRQLAFQVRAPTALWLKFPNDVVNNSHILDTVCTFCIGQLTKFVCFRPEILIHSHRKRQGMTNIRINIVSTCFSDFKVDNTPKNDHAQTPAIAGAPGQPTKK